MVKEHITSFTVPGAARPANVSSGARELKVIVKRLPDFAASLREANEHKRIGMANLADDREAMTRKLKAIRMGAAEISQLLAAGTLTDEDWDRAALILVSCRQERKTLDDDLRQAARRRATASAHRRGS